MLELACPRCGYDLRGSSLRAGSKCPECGHVADWRALRGAGDACYRRKLWCFIAALVPSPVAAGLFFLFVARHAESPAKLAFLALVSATPVIGSILILTALRLTGREERQARPWTPDVLLALFAGAGWASLWVLPLIFALVLGAAG